MTIINFYVTLSVLKVKYQGHYNYILIFIIIDCQTNYYHFNLVLKNVVYHFKVSILTDFRHELDEMLFIQKKSILINLFYVFCLFPINISFINIYFALSLKTYRLFMSQPLNMDSNNTMHEIFINPFTKGITIVCEDSNLLHI